MLQTSLIAWLLVATLLMGCSHTEPVLVAPEDVTFREPSDPSMHAPALADPVNAPELLKRSKAGMQVLVVDQLTGEPVPFASLRVGL